jgi:uncharacterized phage protein (TIGR02218 family)
VVSGPEALAAHLASGSTTVCRCWRVIRVDGVDYGFTDHDEAVAFGGVVFRPESGMTARALEQRTGLSVDNSEVVGVLSDAAIAEADVVAGRFDGAAVEAWLVNWAEPGERMLQFRGSLGEIERAGAEFRAELRGLAEALNQPQGHVYQGSCSAVLGDARCRVDLSTSALVMEVGVLEVVNARTFRVLPEAAYAERWFERGRFRVLSGAAEGLAGIVKADRVIAGVREIELWEEMRAEALPGDAVRVEAGCDKRAATCRGKFGNFMNFRGFPHVPGEDWQMAHPKRAGRNDGGSLNR